jgi:hypothetical protein
MITETRCSNCKAREFSSASKGAKCLFCADGVMLEKDKVFLVELESKRTGDKYVEVMSERELSAANIGDYRVVCAVTGGEM